MLRATPHSRRFLCSLLSPKSSARQLQTQAHPSPSTTPTLLPVPNVATSSLLSQSRDAALSTPGLIWRDDEEVGVGVVAKSDVRGTTKDDLREVEDGGRETKKMNMYQAIRDAMRCALAPKGLLLGKSLCLEPPLSSNPKANFHSLPAAIRDPNPVIFFEPKVLYRSAVEQVPVGDFQLPLSSAEVLREGSDLTIVSWGPPLYTIETALHLLQSPSEDLEGLVLKSLRGLSVELIDLRTIIPYDIETVVKSVNKTVSPDTVDSSLGKRARGIDAVDFDAPVVQPPAGGEVDAAAEVSDDDDVGPMPMPAEAAGPMKKRRTLPHEKLYLDHLPSADRYWKSFMHRDTVTQVAITKSNFLITSSLDGHLKFWKKQEVGIEFVKHYRTHLGPILALGTSDDGRSLACLGADTGGTAAGGGEVKGSAKIFDVENFDMINIIKLPYLPRVCCWVHGRSDGRTLLAITDFDSSAIRIYDGRGDGNPLYTIDKLHRESVHLVSYNERFDTVISIDVGGMIEYWEPQEPFEKPSSVEWTSKSETGLYEYKKVCLLGPVKTLAKTQVSQLHQTKSTPVSLTLSPTGESFAILSLPELRLTTFTFLTGKRHRQYDESLTATQEMQQAGTAGGRLDSMEFGRRLAVERELERLALDAVKNGTPGSVGVGTAAWDEGGKFVLYPTLLGIKGVLLSFVNTVTNKVARMLGKDETVRFLNLALYQGMPIKKGFTTIAMATSENPLLADKDTRDPTLFCTSWKRPRFYMFTRSHPEEKSGDRDVFNEKPTRDELTVAAPSAAAQGPLGRRAVIHTTKGDIALDLFPDQVPKTVENFVGLARKNYYDEVIFHRVIPKFMIQTGDPLGDGTGGESLWGSNFADEFHPTLKHDRPYTLSMANAGPGTNGSQFFITTAPCPWLDNKHRLALIPILGAMFIAQPIDFKSNSIFGRATSGFDVIHEIENARRDKGDKPYDEIRIVSVDIE
ncbi:peptidylprolyl isomerase domain and WD repeat-containing protein 1, partial [Phenoliferia sp. Uapishka_3]